MWYKKLIIFLNKFINFFGKNSIELDCTFEEDENLEVALDRIQKASEIAVRKGIKQIILTDKNISEKLFNKSIIKFYITKTPLLQD